MYGETKLVDKEKHLTGDDDFKVRLVVVFGFEIGLEFGKKWVAIVVTSMFWFFLVVEVGDEEGGMFWGKKMVWECFS